VTETNVFQFSKPGTFADPLAEVLRNTCRRMMCEGPTASNLQGSLV
jgi:hypothetical protein